MPRPTHAEDARKRALAPYDPTARVEDARNGAGASPDGGFLRFPWLFKMLHFARPC